MPRTPKSSPGSALKSGQTVADLREICVKYGLDSVGRKAELVERIKEHEVDQAPTLVKRLGGHHDVIDSSVDANNDGRVTRSEARSYKAPRTPSALKRLKSSEKFAVDHENDHMDANNDGTVTRSEARKFRAETPMTVPNIKAKLSELGLSTKGVKNELLARLGDAMDKLSGAAGSPAGGDEGAAESEMGEVVASDTSSETTLFPVFIGFALVLACIAWHLSNLSQATAKAVPAS